MALNFHSYLCQQVTVCKKREPYFDAIVTYINMLKLKCNYTVNNRCNRRYVFLIFCIKYIK